MSELKKSILVVTTFNIRQKLWFCFTNCATLQNPEIMFWSCFELLCLLVLLIPYIQVNLNLRKVSKLSKTNSTQKSTCISSVCSILQQYLNINVLRKNVDFIIIMCYENRMLIKYCCTASIRQRRVTINYTQKN